MATPQGEITPIRPSPPESPSEYSPEHQDDITNIPPKFESSKKIWWYSAYHNVTAIVGAGVLALPTTMAYLRWEAGTVMLVASWFITLFTLYQMVEMHEMEINGKQKKFKTYHQLGQEAFGDVGRWIVWVLQIIVQVGADIVYMLTGGQSLWLFYQLLLCKKSDPIFLGNGDRCCGRLGRTTFTLIFAIPQFLFAQLAHFDSIAFLSLLASVMSICYSTLAWVEAWKRGTINHSAEQTSSGCSTDYNAPHDISVHKQVIGVFNALGIIAFAYAGHNVVLEIQSTMPSTKEEPSSIQMFRGVVVAYVIVAFCYFPVAFVGYWAFGSRLAHLANTSGNPSSGNILYQLDRPRGVIAAGSFMVFIHVTGSYQLFAVPVFDILESWVESSRFGPTKQTSSEEGSTPQGPPPLAQQKVSGSEESTPPESHPQIYDPNQSTRGESESVAYTTSKSILGRITSSLGNGLTRIFCPVNGGERRSISLMMRIVTRSTYVCLTALVACAFPFFQDLMAFFGGLAITLTTYFLPCMIWLWLKKPTPFSINWLINWSLIIIGGLLTLVATLGGLLSLSNDTSQYHDAYQFICDSRDSKKTSENCSLYYFE